MTRRTSYGASGLARKLVHFSLVLTCCLMLPACDDGLEPAHVLPAESNKDAGARGDGGMSTSSSSATTRDGGSADGGRSSESGMASAGGMSAGGGTPGGGMSGGNPGGTTGDGGAAAGPVVAACMGHAGENVCDGASLVRCGAAANAESRVACGSEARCRAGLMTGTCGECDPGTAICMGAMLRECDTNGTYSKVTPCPSEALCSAMNKSCNPSQCGADAYTCEMGFLKKCKPDLSGFDMGTQCKSQELCSAADKRCNDCKPNDKVCDGDTLMVCGADGKGPMAMPCSGMTSRCNKDKCVQCKADADCMTMEDCRVAKCNVGTGMCTNEVAARGTKCGGGSKFCDLLGGCQQCLDDSNCSSSQRCSLTYTCVDRAPLALSLLGCGFTLSAGFDLKLDAISPSSGRTMEITGSQFIFADFTIRTSDSAGKVFVTSGTQTRSYSLAGVEGSSSISCSSRGLSDSSAEFTLTNSSNTASTVTLTLTATRK